MGGASFPANRLAISGVKLLILTTISTQTGREGSLFPNRDLQCFTVSGLLHVPRRE